MELKEMFHALVSPMDAFKKYGGKVSWGEAFKDVAVAGILLGVSAGFGIFLSILLGLGIAGPSGMNIMSNFGSGLGIAFAVGAWIMSIVLTPIEMIIGWLIGSLLLWIVAKILGGKADYSEQTTNLSFVQAPAMLASAVVAWIPVIGSILAGLVWLYTLYPLTINLRETHRFSTEKAVLTWLVWAIIGIIISALTGITWITTLGTNPSVYIQ